MGFISALKKSAASLKKVSMSKSSPVEVIEQPEPEEPEQPQQTVEPAEPETRTATFMPSPAKLLRRSGASSLLGTSPARQATPAISPAAEAAPSLEQDVSATASQAQVVATPAGAAQVPVANSSQCSPERLPTPPNIGLEWQESELVSFEVPKEQVVATVGGAFGRDIPSLLQSSSWDKRVQALKSVSETVKGLGLGGMAKPGHTGALPKGLKLKEREARWRIACQLLSHVLHDKVMFVRLAAHDLFIDTFAIAEGLISPEEVQLALGYLVDPVLEQLGDSNLKMHESARKLTLFCAEDSSLLGLEAVLARLQAKLTATVKTSEKAKVYFGVLDAVNHLLEHFPVQKEIDAAAGDDDDAAQAQAASWTVDAISPFIVAGMDDIPGFRVRNSALALAVTAYRTFGMDALTPVVSGLRPAKQALLKQKFQESDAESAGNVECSKPKPSTSKIAGPAVSPKGKAVQEAELQHEATPDLMLCGKAIRPRNGSEIVSMPMPPLQNGLNDLDEEEALMDSILEEAGVVFAGASIANGTEPSWRPKQTRGSPTPKGPTMKTAKTADRLLLEKLLPGVVIDPLFVGREHVDVGERQMLEEELRALAGPTSAYEQDLRCIS
eukprot:gnl/TRDRNA2_/TRDRNA2_180295_c0_seq1.p1 gnl/TRDRNA2_/TRDRNA2_180295_c0~~gnl/TRDRNA2_/TRDRNA2_180295_c0_seq1.p1  ORF type:complete len:612 (-),score=129.38 gnl/TRDRNA2_/TRDRNA2_180295_c0_seq1:266-2101(-)